MTVFNFTDDELRFMEDLRLNGVIHSEHAERILSIHKSRVNPGHDFCTSCGEAMRANYQLLYQIMCESVRVKDLSEYFKKNSTKKTEKKTDPQPDPEPEKTDANQITKDVIMSKTKDQLIKLVWDELGIEIKPKTRAQARKESIELFKIE